MYTGIGKILGVLCLSICVYGCSQQEPAHKESAPAEQRENVKEKKADPPKETTEVLYRRIAADSVWIASS